MKEVLFNVTDGDVFWAGRCGSVAWSRDSAKATAVSRSEAMVIKSNYRRTFPLLRLRKAAALSAHEAARSAAAEEA